jgi:hypothetical protein
MNYQGKKGVPDRLRFEASFTVAECGCWLWTGATDEDGYGQFWDSKKQRRVRAHRWSFEEFVRPLEKNENACHTCDTPSCVYPRHLFPGTNKINNEDRSKKGRNAGWASRSGEEHSQAKLTTEDVVTIRRLSKEGLLQRKIAARYHIHQSHVSDIVNNKVWNHA